MEPLERSCSPISLISSLSIFCLGRMFQLGSHRIAMYSASVRIWLLISIPLPWSYNKIHKKTNCISKLIEIQMVIQQHRYTFPPWQTFSYSFWYQKNPVALETKVEMWNICYVPIHDVKFTVVKPIIVHLIDTTVGEVQMLPLSNVPDIHLKWGIEKTGKGNERHAVRKIKNKRK